MKQLIRMAAIVLAVMFLAGCNDAKEIPATEFQAMLARNPESMRHTEFVGVKDGKAFLKVSTMSSRNQKKWTESYCITDADQLPQTWLQEQQAAANTIDKDITIELSVRLEVNGRVEDSRKAHFTIAEGSKIPDKLSLTSAEGAALTFQSFRTQDGNAVFDAWGFNGLLPFESQSGTRVTAWPYKANDKNGFSIPMDGSNKLDKLLTSYDKTAVNGEMMEVYVSLDIKAH